MRLCIPAGYAPNGTEVDGFRLGEGFACILWGYALKRWYVYGGYNALSFYLLLPDNLQRHVFDSYKDKIEKWILKLTLKKSTRNSICRRLRCSKEQLYKGAGCKRLSSYEIGCVYRESEEHRAWRASRIPPGHWYRLYSSVVFSQNSAKFREPEVLPVPSDAIVRNIASYGNSECAKLSFPNMSTTRWHHCSENLLDHLGALETNVQSYLFCVTKIVRELALITVDRGFYDW